MSAVASPSGYSITDLGMGGANPSRAMSINDSGQAIATFGSSAYIYSGGSLTLVPTLGGTVNYALGVGYDGTVLGGSTNSGGQYSPYKSLNGTTTALPNYGDGGFAFDMNGSGLIVGKLTKYQFIFVDRAVKWSGNTATELSMAGRNYNDNSGALAVNASGVIVGSVDDLNDYRLQNAAVWTGNTLTVLPALSVDYVDSQSVGISDAGSILVNHTGGPFGSVPNRTTVYSGGSYTDLGDLGGGSASGLAMNSLGAVVGTSTLANSTDASFLWTSTGGMVNLSSMVVGSTYSSFSALDINSSGQVIGLAQLTGSGVYRSIILTPQAVPEPASMVALGLGAAALLRRRRKA